MYLHHTLTDSELIRACDNVEGQPLRMLADRLHARSMALRDVVAAYRRIGSGELADLAQLAGRDVLPLLDDFLIHVDRLAEDVDGDPTID